MNENLFTANRDNCTNWVVRRLKKKKRKKKEKKKEKKRERYIK
jgi:hypothetical protein